MRAHPTADPERKSPIRVLVFRELRRSNDEQKKKQKQITNVEETADKDRAA